MLQALEPGNYIKMVVRSALICLCGLISAQFSEGELILVGTQRRDGCEICTDMLVWADISTVL